MAEVPCQCEHSLHFEEPRTVHEHLAVPAGEACAMFLGPICDACVTHMQGYLLTGEDAERARKEVTKMYEDYPPPPQRTIEPGTQVELMENGEWTGEAHTVTALTGRTPNHLVLRTSRGNLFELYNDAPYNVRPYQEKGGDSDSNSNSRP